MSMSSLQQILQDPVLSQAIRIGLNLAGMSVLVFGLYYRRYRDKELVTAAALFNVFIFAVLTILSSVNFSVAAGFGLFAILALFTLRSEPLSKTEMTYFFGAVAIAVITSVQGTTVPFAALAVSFVLAGAYVIDHPRILQSVSGAKVTLDKINTDLLADPAAMRAELSERLGVAVLSYQVLQLDYITEMARLNVYYRTR
jgi:predicted membrane protein